MSEGKLRAKCVKNVCFICFIVWFRKVLKFFSFNWHCKNFMEINYAKLILKYISNLLLNCILDKSVIKII